MTTQPSRAHAVSKAAASDPDPAVPASTNPAHLLPRLRKDLPYPVLIAASWSACILLISAGVWVVGRSLGHVSTVLIPLAIALLICAMMEPLNRFLRTKLRFPSPAAALVAELVFFLAVLAAFSLAIERMTRGLSEIVSGATEGINEIVRWLENGPLRLSVPDPSSLLDRVSGFVKAGPDSPLFSGALRVGVTTADTVAGLLICFIATFFFLHEGPRIWRFLLSFLPAHSRHQTHEAARRGWVSLGSYARAQLLVAGINAVGIGVGAWAIGLPLVIPITVIVYLLSFIPIVGAFISGFVAILIAFVDKGMWAAVAMLAVVLLVHFIESNVLHPFVMGHAVSVHPLAVICSVATGTYLFGLPGALFAVPLVATLNSSIRYLVGKDPFPELGYDPDGPAPVDAAESRPAAKETPAADANAASATVTSDEPASTP